MAVARKIAYIVILNSFLKVFSTVALSLLSIRLITGYLGQDGFGDYATVLAFFSFFSAIADLGIGAVTAREISREGADEGKILGHVISLRILSAAAFILLSPAVIFFFDYPKDVEIGILIAAVATVFSTLSLTLNGIFQKHLAMDKVAMVEFLGKLLQVGAVFLIVKADWGFLAIAATLLVSLSWNALVVLLISRRYTTFRLRIDVPAWKAFLRESWPMGMTAIITFAYFKMDTILLSVLQTSSDVGIYNVAYKIMENLIFFPAMLAGLVLPLLSRSIFTDRAHFDEIANKTFKVFLIIVLPLIIGTWFLASDIIAIVSGADFLEAAPVLRILVFALGFIFFGHYFNMLLIVGNAQKRLMQTLIIAAIFNILLNLFLIREYSYIGAACAALGTEMLVVLLTSTLARREIHFLPSFENISRIALSAFAMAAALFLLEPFSFLLSGIVGVAVYILVLWLTNAVNHTELMSLFQKGGSSTEEAEHMETMLP
jgi:O-antigen/teichoic acid export membrane protein